MAAFSYDDAVEVLERALVFGIHPSLDGITALCEALDRPQDAFESVQITGTNGKTSTARMTAAMLRLEGVRTGLFTSPHLERYPERIELDGAVISDSTFAAAVRAASRAAESLRGGAHGTEAGFTEFELVTAAALHAFREAGVEVAVLEVGMGGRWDATSVVTPRVAVATGVSLDHMAVLGDTVEEIAAEKAAIIKPGSLAVLGPGTVATRRIFEERARECGCESIVVDDAVSGITLPPYMPSHQARNAAMARAAAQAVLGRPLSDQAASRALGALRLPARFETVRVDPTVVVDGSHNPEAAGMLAEAIRERWPDPKHGPLVLLGVLADKDARGIVRALAPVAAAFVVTRPAHDRAMDASGLAGIVAQETGVRPACFDVLADALSHALTVADAGIVATGSLVTAGAVRSLLCHPGDGSIHPRG